MDSLGELGEFGYIARITRNLPTSENIVAGVGDDCAVVRHGDKLLLVSCDASIEDVHFSRRLAQPYDIGWKTFAAAFSDIAAMGGKPLYAVASLAVPPDTPVDILDELSKGAHDCVEHCGALLIGGDTTRSPGPVMLDVTVLGEPVDGRYVLRSGARHGDILAHTGVLGLSAGGLCALQQGLRAPDLTRAHLHPEPRIAAGQWLAARHSCHAMMDISDGLLQDAGHLADASGLGIAIDSGLLHLDELEPWEHSLGCSALDLATAGGEDYELLVAVDAASFGALRAAFERELKLPLTAVGRFTRDHSRVRMDGHEAGAGGFDHFREE